MAARRRKSKKASQVAMRSAVKMECKICKKDLTAQPTKVPNPFGADRAPATALRSPERCVLTFQFAGFNPLKATITIPLCVECSGRVTFTSAGVPLMIDPESQAIEAQGRASASETRQAALIAELQGVLARFK